MFGKVVFREHGDVSTASCFTSEFNSEAKLRLQTLNLVTKLSQNLTMFEKEFFPGTCHILPPSLLVL